MKRPREDETEEAIVKRVKVDTEQEVENATETNFTTSENIEDDQVMESVEDEDEENENESSNEDDENEDEEDEDEEENDDEDEEDEEEDEDESEDDIHTINTEQYKWHFDMLNDQERVEAFSNGLKKTMNNLTKPNEEIVVLDIGAGTGYLGLCAAKHGCKTSYFIDSDPVLVEIINENAKRNNVENCVAVPGLSTEVALPEKADILVAEVLDSGLIGENFLVTLRDAKERLCQPNTVIVPAKAQVFGILVESSVLASYQSFSDLSLDPCGNPSCVHYEQLVKLGQAKSLSEPFPVFNFDFNNLPPTAGRKQKQTVPVTENGQLSVIVYFWQCSIDTEAEYTISTASNQSRSHWRHAISFLKPTEKITVQQGTNVDVHCFHTDEDIWFSLSENTSDELTLPVGHDLFSTFLPEHVALWNDQDFITKFTSQLGHIQGKNCLNITGNVFLTKLLADNGAAKVISIDSAPIDIQYETACEIEFIEDPSEMTSDFDCTFFTPYELPGFGWDTLLFCFQNNIYPEVFPNHAKLYVSAIECETLWNMYNTLDQVENVDLEAVNQMHIQDSIFTTQYWMYDHKVLCEPTAVQTFDFSAMTEEYNVDVHLNLTNPGQFDFLVFWFDFNDLGLHDPSKIFAYQAFQRSAERKQVSIVDRKININLNEEMFYCVDPTLIMDVNEEEVQNVETEVVENTAPKTAVINAAETPAVVVAE